MLKEETAEGIQESREEEGKGKTEEGIADYQGV